MSVSREDAFKNFFATAVCCDNQGFLEAVLKKKKMLPRHELSHSEAMTRVFANYISFVSKWEKPKCMPLATMMPLDFPSRAREEYAFYDWLLTFTKPMLNKFKACKGIKAPQIEGYSFNGDKETVANMIVNAFNDNWKSLKNSKRKKESAMRRKELEAQIKERKKIVKRRQLCSAMLNEVDEFKDKIPDNKYLNIANNLKELNEL